MAFLQTIPLLSLFLSGFGALLLQEVWTRAGVLVFGSTTVSVTVVIATFMAGLALGYALIARVVNRMKRPFWAYGIVEVLAGLTALGTSLFLDSGPMAWNAPKVLVIFLLLLPTTLMGLTVPLVVAGLERASRDWAGPSLAWAYGINTLGGAGGAFLGAFWIMPMAGVSASGFVGSLFLVLAGVLTLFVAPMLTSERVEITKEKDEQVSIRPMIYTIAFVGGACGLSLEIVWTRLLSLVFGPSVYALGIVLSVNLVGIGVGSLLCPSVLKRVEPERAVIGGLFLGACSIALGTAMVGILPYLFLFLVEHMDPRVETLRVVEVILSSLTILPITLVQGILLPILVSWSTAGSLAKNAGKLFSVNTVGSILGAAATGLWLIPRFGFLPSLILFFVVYFLLGLHLFGWKRNIWVTAICLVFSVIFPWRAEQFWDQAVLASGVYKYAVGAALGGDQDAKIEVGKLLYYREGISSTVAVIKTQGDRVLSIDGKADATAYGDQSTQILLGALPLSLSAQTDSTLVVGFASGVTAGVSSLFPSSHVTAVDIEPAVYEAAEFFLDVNHGPLLPPRHKKLVQDARHFLLRTDQSFDVITSEPSNPWMSGVGPLFTKEFFTLASSRLSTGGVMCQWLPIYGMTGELVASVMRTFASVFPHVMVFESIEGYDVLMIGSMTPRLLDPKKLESRWKNAALRKSLAAIGIRSGLDLVGRFTMGKAGIRRFVGNAPENTDGNGFVEFRAPQALHLRTAAQNNRKLSRASVGFEDYLETSKLTRVQIDLLREQLLKRGETQAAKELLR